MSGTAATQPRCIWKTLRSLNRLYLTGYSSGGGGTSTEAMRSALVLCILLAAGPLAAQETGDISTVIVPVSGS